MLPGAITRKTADPRLAAGRFTAYEDTTGRQTANPKPLKLGGKEATEEALEEERTVCDVILISRAAGEVFCDDFCSTPSS